MRPTRRGRIVVLLGILAGLAAIAAVAGYFFLTSIGVVGGDDPLGSVEVHIPRGADASEVANLLEEKEVIASALGFRITVYLEGGAADIQAGRYELRRGLSARGALRALAKGPQIDFVNVTFPEGSWLTDFARVLGEETDIPAERFLALVESGGVRSKLQPEGVNSLEGLLWPATYQIVDQDGPRSVAERLVTELENRVAEIGFAQVEATGVSEYEAITVASMIEAEALVDEERAMIARVIYNRLQVGMPLGIDATISYALGEHKTALTESDLAVDSPYNTRLETGLPPTPIGAPGQASLEAAAHPAQGQWLFYVVSDCAGHHAFSVDYDDFLADKAAYQELSC